MVDGPEGQLVGSTQTEEVRQQVTSAVCEYLQQALDGHEGGKRWRKQFSS